MHYWRQLGFVTLFLLAGGPVALADIECKAAWRFDAGDKSYTGYGPTESAARADARRICAAYQPLASMKAICTLNEPHAVSCNERGKGGTVSRRGDIATSVVFIEKNDGAEIHNPACGSGRWSRCEKVCVEPEKGERIAEYKVQLGEYWDMGGFCRKWPDDPLGADKGWHYRDCPKGGGDCGTYSGVEPSHATPTGGICVTGKNWSGSWPRCARIEARFEPEPPPSKLEQFVEWAKNLVSKK